MQSCVKLPGAWGEQVDPESLGKALEVWFGRFGIRFGSTSP